MDIDKEYQKAMDFMTDGLNKLIMAQKILENIQKTLKKEREAK